MYRSCSSWLGGSVGFEMSSIPIDQREKVRELVRQVLATVPVEDAAQTDAASEPEHVVVNSLRDRLGRDWDRDESARTLITEDDLRGLEPGSRVRVAAAAKFTPLAEDIVRENELVLIRKEPRQFTAKVRSVAIGADHGGFRSKQQLSSFLADLGINVRDVGTDSEDPVDYPDIAHDVARAVSSGRADIGILIDGAGIGSAIAANKVPGVRAAQCYNTALARNSREHNGANVLTLGAGQNSLDEMKAIIEAFISTAIAEERHKKRVSKIDTIDRQYRV